MEFCKVCGVPFDAKMQKHSCEKCAKIVCKSCLKEIDGMVICGSCIRKKAEIRKRVESKFVAKKAKSSEDDW